MNTPPHDPANPIVQNQAGMHKKQPEIVQSELEQELQKMVGRQMPHLINGENWWPGRYVAEREAQAYERGAADYITWGYGKRCKTKDLHDFPDLKEGERCPSCEEWEHYDEWLLEKGKPE